MKKIVKWVSVVLLILIIIFIIFKIKGGKKQVQFRTATVELSDISNTVIATGKIYPHSRVEIKSKIGGIVTKFYIEEGDSVKIGRRLADIIPGTTPIELVRTRDEVRKALFNKENAKKLADQAKILFDKKLISEKDYFDLKTSYEITQSQFYSAMAQLKVLEKGSGTIGLSSKIKLTEEDKIAVEKEAKEALTSMTLIAPINGIVLSRDTDEGTTVTPISSAAGGTVIMVLADVRAMLFKGDVDEVDIGKIRENTPVRIHVESYPDRTFSGKMKRISPLGRETNNLVNFTIEVGVDDPEKLLRVGMSADAELILAEHKNVLTVPEGTIYYNNDSTYVFVLDSLIESGKRKVSIHRGISDGIKTEVLSGLKKGQKVIFKD